MRTDACAVRIVTHDRERVRAQQHVEPGRVAADGNAVRGDIDSPGPLLLERERLHSGGGIQLERADRTGHAHIGHTRSGESRHGRVGGLGLEDERLERLE